MGLYPYLMCYPVLKFLKLLFLRLVVDLQYDSLSDEFIIYIEAVTANTVIISLMNIGVPSNRI